MRISLSPGLAAAAGVLPAAARCSDRALLFKPFFGAFGQSSVAAGNVIGSRMGMRDAGVLLGSTLLLRRATRVDA